MAIQVPENYTYLDWAATAPLSDAAAQAMEPFLRPGKANVAYGLNANSLHAPGRAAFEALENARRQMARDLGCSRPNELVFTSGATEADNMALLGIARALRDERRKRDGAGVRYRVITTEVEHEAVLEPAHELAREGFDVQYAKPGKDGFVTREAIEALLTDDTLLVSVQVANSEIGTIHPLPELVEAAHEHGALFHADATQALGKMPLDLGQLGVDAASFSAHKIGGPKGVGALYLKARTPFRPLLLGGGQEDGRRSTTQNVCGVVGFAAACHEAVTLEERESQRQRGLRDWLYAELRRMPGIRPTIEVPAGSREHLPNIVHALASAYESETLVLRLDRAGFGVSGGSACSSHSLEPSRVLKAIGVSTDEAYGALRVSLGRYTEEEDLRRFMSALSECLS